MKIEILGTGCGNCIKLEMLIYEIVQSLGKTDIQVVRVDDEQYIRRHMPLDAIPGLMINGYIVSTRRVPDRETLQSWVSEV